MSEASVSREAGYLVYSEPTWGDEKPCLDRVGERVRDVAMYVIDSFEYYLDNDAMIDIKAITDDGGAASLEIEVEQGTVSLTIFRSAPEGEKLELPLKKEAAA